MMSRHVTNWAGNVTFRPQYLHRPTSIGELQDIVARAYRARALGSGHSFNRIADTTGDMIAVDRLPSVIDIDSEQMTVQVSAGTRYGELAAQLQRRGLALHNLGSLPHISVAGACATGTHGSGNANGTLPSAVKSVTLVTADGALTTLCRGDTGFDGAVISLGALGIVTSLVVELCPTFDVEQYVYEGLGWSSLVAHFDTIMASGYSVSVFTDWRQPGQVWVKHRSSDPFHDLTDIGARPAQRPLHPVAGVPATNCTPQMGVRGPWNERLPHFRAEFRPATGDELQSEYLIPKTHAAAALEALRRIRGRFAPALQISEIRTVASDECWLSPSHHRDSVAIHFTWKPDMHMVSGVLADVEEALTPFDARPHWGKLFTTGADVLAASYENWTDFGRFMKALDPRGKFRNGLINQYFPL